MGRLLTLKQADPALRIVVAEARFAGSGASGRNGGWLSGLAPGHRGILAKKHGRDAVVEWQRTLDTAVDDVIEVARREGIDADIVKGGPAGRTQPRPGDSASACRGGPRLGKRRDRSAVGLETAERVRVAGIVAGSFNPHCARVQPAKLVRGLADVVERPASRSTNRLP